MPADRSELHKLYALPENGRLLDETLDRMLETDYIISDLDHTVAYSPAAKIAYSFLNLVTRYDRFFSCGFWGWALPCFLDLAWDYATGGQDAEERQWKRFHDRFLTDPEELDLQTRLHVSQAKSSAFPGLLDFYQLFPHAKKAMVTRNIPQIARAYASVYGYDLVVANAYDQERSIDEALDAFPERRNVLFKGDAKSDENLLRILKSKQKQGRIDNLVSINVLRRLSRPHPDFDITIPRNYEGIVGLLLLHKFNNTSNQSNERCPIIYRLKTPRYTA